MTENNTDAAERDAVLNEAKEIIIKSLVKDSRETLHGEDLEKLSLDALKNLRAFFEDAVGSIYAEILANRQARRDSQKRSFADKGTGVYNQETGKWEGGLPEPEEE
jgi:hypothetical protein